jgi:hypothetical protein
MPRIECRVDRFAARKRRNECYNYAFVDGELTARARARAYREACRNLSARPARREELLLYLVSQRVSPMRRIIREIFACEDAMSTRGL